MEALAKTLAELLDHAIKQGGLKLPVIQIAVSANGQVFAVRFDQLGAGSRGTPLCEYVDGRHFKMPINFYFSDPSGHSVRAIITAKGKAPTWASWVH